LTQITVSRGDWEYEGNWIGKREGVEMVQSPGQDMVREAVAVFDTADDLEQAIDKLQQSGFNRAEISLLADAHAVEQKLGHAYQRAADLEDDPNVPRTAFISTESIGDAEGGLIGGLMYVGAMIGAGAVVASGVALPAIIAGATLTGASGGLIGAALAGILDRHHAEFLEEQLKHGGLLLWVRTRDTDHEERATEILSRHSAHDVHVHSLPIAGM
jgi:hypothetical protein